MNPKLNHVFGPVLRMLIIILEHQSQRERAMFKVGK
jgi:hypothetical protein